MIKYHQGDIIKFINNYEFDIVIHSANCFLTMGVGVAKSLKDHFPQVFESDQLTIGGRREKLGTFSYAFVKRNPDVVVLNCYCQFHYGNDTQQFNYNAFRNVLKDINFMFSGKVIGMPKIGCGLAGGNWDTTSKIIEEELTEMKEIIVVEYHS